MKRYQYRIVQLGMFNAVERMAAAFAQLGEQGWELVAMYDKSSNWWQGLEKGFALFKREVAPGEEPNGDWCIVDGRDAFRQPTPSDGTPQFYG